MRIYNRLMEVFWFAAGVFTLGLSIYLINDTSFEEGAIYLAMPAVCFALWYLRRNFRKRLQQQQEHEGEAK